MDAVSSEPGQQSVSEANAVNLTCDYSNGGPNVSFEELPEVPFAHAAVEQPNAVAPFQQRFADGLCFRFAGKGGDFFDQRFDLRVFEGQSHY